MWSFRDEACETGEEYEKELVALKGVLTDCLEASEELFDIEKLAALILGQRNKFPEVFERHQEVEPMLGDIMSRRVQGDFFKTFTKPGKE